MHRAARIVQDQYDGKIPDDMKAIRQLPGVGDYIAAAVLSIAYSQAYPVVDGNVKRVLSRIFCNDAPVNRSSSLGEYRRLANRIISSQEPGDFNQAMMESGATVCTVRNPDCLRCPVADFCKALEAGSVSRFPKRMKSSPIPERQIAIGVVFRDGRMLVTRRTPDGFLGGLWEFPGGGIEPGESPEDACVREIGEETGISVEIGSHLTRIRHAYTHFRIVADVYLCRYRNGRMKLDGPIDYRWITLNEIDRYPFPKANHKFIPLLRETIQNTRLQPMERALTGDGS